MADHVSSTIVIKAQPAAVLAVVADISRYPDWSDALTSAEVIETTPAGLPAKARFQAKTTFGKEDYTLVYDWAGPTSVTWTMLESDRVRTLDGSYTLTDLGDGSTEVTYDLTVELKVPIPGLLRRKAEDKLVESALYDLKTQVER
ncbi:MULTISPECIES: SRPBCC family protein [Frankia]|uniref:SRPBCC family protein n=1 Tax=Frankia TaxID=1854 RepID=UPI0013D24B1B|nr:MULTISPECIES: SRPBCC family protein [Frankia]